VAVGLVPLIAAGAVLAANPTKEKIQFTAAGQAQAKSEVLHRGDIGAGGWKGGYKKPDLSSTMPNCSYRPKQSDLTVNGAAETRWQSGAVELDSEAQVLKTAKMVSLDWQRTVLAPQVTPCLKRGIAKSVGATGTLVSFARVSFPRLATYTRAFRAIVAIKTTVGKVRIESDVVVFGAKRNELTLTITGVAAAKGPLRQTQLRLARLLAGKLR
jgi:hypothetical protein